MTLSEERDIMRSRKAFTSIAGLEKLTPEQIKQRNRETYGDSIKKYRKKAGITAEELASVLQIAKSSVRNWECGLTRPDPEYLYRMFTILDVEPNEFFGFSGVGTLLTSNEKKIIQNYRSLDETGKEDFETYAEAMSRKVQTRKLKAAYLKMQTVSSFGRVAAAGDGSDWDDHPEEENVLLFTTPEVARADEIFTVNGESMEPMFHNKDRVLVQYCNELNFGDIGIFYVPGHGGVIKQVAHDRLHSINPDYDDIFIYEEGAKPVGKVIGRITKELVPGPEDMRLYEHAAELFEK